jgi:hypothetical protein
MLLVLASALCGGSLHGAPAVAADPSCSALQGVDIIGAGDEDVFTAGDEATVRVMPASASRPWAEGWGYRDQLR